MKQCSTGLERPFIPLHVQDHLLWDACHVNYQYHIHTVTNCNQQNDYGGYRKHAGECWSSLSLCEVQSWYVPRGTNRNCNWSLAPHQLSLDSTITVHKFPVPWLRQLVTSCLPHRPEFNPRSVQVGCVVAKVAMGQVSLFTAAFLVSIISPMLHTHSFIHSWITDTI